jgi:hypothetical protein
MLTIPPRIASGKNGQTRIMRTSGDVLTTLSRMWNPLTIGRGIENRDYVTLHREELKKIIGKACDWIRTQGKDPEE